MSRFLKIGEAAKLLGVSIQTLRRWERKKNLVPDYKSPGGTRYYCSNKIADQKTVEPTLTMAYARVSSHDQKEDLQR